ELRRITTSGAIVGETVEVDASAWDARFLLSIPEAGPWSGETLLQSAQRQEAHSAVAWSLEPRLEDPQWPLAPLFIDGELLAWPGEPQTLLSFSPEGRVLLSDPPDFPPGVLTFDNGTTFSLVGVN